MIIWDTLKIQNSGAKVELKPIKLGNVDSLNFGTYGLVANYAQFKNSTVRGTATFAGSVNFGQPIQLPVGTTFAGSVTLPAGTSFNGAVTLPTDTSFAGTLSEFAATNITTNIITPISDQIVLGGNVKITGTLTKSDDGDVDMVGKPFLYVDVYEQNLKDGLIIAFIGPEKNGDEDNNYELSVTVNNNTAATLNSMKANTVYGYFPDTHRDGINQYQVTVKIGGSDLVTTGTNNRDGARSTDGFKGQIFIPTKTITEFNVPSKNITKVNNIIIQRCSVTSGLIASFADDQTDIKPCSSPNVEAGLIGRLQAEAIIQCSDKQKLSINAYAYAYAEYKKDTRLDDKLRDTSMVVAPQYWIED